MNQTTQLAKHLREVYFGGNWTWSNLRDQLADVTWQQATAKIQSCNTIAQLTYHIHYYVAAQIKVLQGGPLDAHDKFAFACPPIESQAEWDDFRQKILADAEILAELIEKLPDTQLPENFVMEKYGSYQRNFLGLIEHTHYHLGQIAILKKLLPTEAI